MSVPSKPNVDGNSKLFLLVSHESSTCSKHNHYKGCTCEINLSEGKKVERSTQRGGKKGNRWTVHKNIWWEFFKGKFCTKNPDLVERAQTLFSPLFSWIYIFSPSIVSYFQTVGTFSWWRHRVQVYWWGASTLAKSSYIILVAAEKIRYFPLDIQRRAKGLPLWSALPNLVSVAKKKKGIVLHRICSVKV